MILPFRDNLATEVVVNNLAMDCLVTLAATASFMSQACTACRNVLVLYNDDGGDRRVLLRVSIWETQESVQEMICRFTHTWMPHVQRSTDNTCWVWIRDCPPLVHHGVRWSTTGIGIGVLAIGLLKMQNHIHGHLLLADGSAPPVEMQTPLANWNTYNDRGGHHQSDHVEASCIWEGGVLKVEHLDDVPSSIGSTDLND